MRNLVLENGDYKPFEKSIAGSFKGYGEGVIKPLSITTLQVNVGALCNLSCGHCHVSSGPGRSEEMALETLKDCVAFAARSLVNDIDITGGSPEMNPYYRQFVDMCLDSGRSVKTRTNLVVLLQDGFRDIPRFWAERKVEVVASLPHYTESQTDRMRGKGVFKASIEALKVLNELGYGTHNTGLVLNLVYNPCGAFLPPTQKDIENDFRVALNREYSIKFNNLFAITNMPVGRFLSFLERTGNLGAYMGRLVSSFNPSAVASVMCRNMVSIGWDGTIYDCDFNQMLGLRCSGQGAARIKEASEESLMKRTIITGMHCYGCTSGAGSSCAGEHVVS